MGHIAQPSPGAESPGCRIHGSVGTVSGLSSSVGTDPRDHSFRCRSPSPEEGISRFASLGGGATGVSQQLGPAPPSSPYSRAAPAPVTDPLTVPVTVTQSSPASRAAAREPPQSKSVIAPCRPPAAPLFPLPLGLASPAPPEPLPRSALPCWGTRGLSAGSESGERVADAEGWVAGHRDKFQPHLVIIRMGNKSDRCQDNSSRHIPRLVTARICAW